MRTVWEVIKFSWPILEIILTTAIIVIAATFIIGILIGFFNDEAGAKIGNFGNWLWRNNNGRWFIMVIATILTLLTAITKTYIEPSPVNWEIREEMSDKNSKLNKSASYFWAYIKGSKVEKKEDIFLDVEPMKTGHPSGPGWWIKFWIIFWLTLAYTFKAWSDEAGRTWDSWRKRHEENKEAKKKKEEEPHKTNGFFNYFVPAFLADVMNNFVEHWKK